MNCPRGHGPMVPGQRFWLCEECDCRVPLKAEAALPPPALPAGVAGLPSVLAIPLSEYFGETHPVMRLHRLCDAAEIVTRFLTIVALGKWLAQRLTG